MGNNFQEQLALLAIAGGTATVSDVDDDDDDDRTASFEQMARTHAGNVHQLTWAGATEHGRWHGASNSENSAVDTRGHSRYGSAACATPWPCDGTPLSLWQM